MAEVVDGLTWTRSKPDLRMYREMFGMSTAEFGRLAAVDGRTVRAWENPRFRLMTDMLHLGGEKGSVLFGVTRQTVFAWRHPRMRDSVPSPAAVDALDARWSAMVARASELAGMMSVAADRAAADGRRRMAPPLTFYRLRSDWEAWHGPDDGGWRSEDCSVWLAAVLLHDMGLEPSVVYAEADPEAMF